MAGFKSGASQYRPIATVDEQDDDIPSTPQPSAAIEVGSHDGDADNGGDDELAAAAARDGISSAAFRAEVLARSLWQPGGRIDFMAGAIDAALYPVFTQAAVGSTPSSLITLKTLGIAGVALSALVTFPIAQILSIYDRARTLVVLWVVFQIAVLLSMAGSPLVVLGITMHIISQAGFALWLPVLLCEVFQPHVRGLVIAALAFPVVVTSEAIERYLSGISLLSLLNPGLLGLGGLISGGVLAASAAIWRVERKLPGAVMSWKGRHGSVTLRGRVGESLWPAAGLALLLLPAALVTAGTPGIAGSSSVLTMLLWTLAIVAAAVVGVILLIFSYSRQRESSFPSKRFSFPAAIISELSTSPLVNIIILTAIDAAIPAAAQRYAAGASPPAVDSTLAIWSQCLTALLAGVAMLLFHHAGRVMLLPAAASKALGTIILLFWHQDGLLVQLLIGIGSGVIQTAALVMAQVIAAEEHDDINTFNLAPITAAVAAAAYAGGSLGTSLAAALPAGWLPSMPALMSVTLVILSMRTMNVGL